MRTVTYSAACSLDGYIEGSDGSFDWLHFSPDVDELMGQYWSTVDTVGNLLGGGELAASLFDAGAIDMVSLNVHLVLRGSGVRFFWHQAPRLARDLTE